MDNRQTKDSLKKPCGGWELQQPHPCHNGVYTKTKTCLRYYKLIL